MKYDFHIIVVLSSRISQVYHGRTQFNILIIRPLGETLWTCFGIAHLESRGGKFVPRGFIAEGGKHFTSVSFYWNSKLSKTLFPFLPTHSPTFYLSLSLPFLSVKILVRLLNSPLAHEVREDFKSGRCGLGRARGRRTAGVSSRSGTFRCGED